MSPRVIKAGLEIALGGHISGWLIQARHSDGLLVLAFHNVVPSGRPQVGDRPLHLPIPKFVELIHRLLDLGTFCALEQPAHSDPGLRFAVTFDDAYAGAVRVALPELVRLGIPATVFVPTGRVGGRSFWWDALALGEGGLEPELRRHALEGLRGDDDLIRSWAERNGRLPIQLPEEWHSATLDDLRTAAQLPGIQLAPHSSTHRALDRLNNIELRAELIGPFAWFEGARLPYRRLLAYPYGRYSRQVEALAVQGGYEAAWGVSGGWTDRASDVCFSRPRLNVSAGATVRGTMLRVAGLLRT